jgi:hypothetical protein
LPPPPGYYSFLYNYNPGYRAPHRQSDLVDHRLTAGRKGYPCIRPRARYSTFFVLAEGPSRIQYTGPIRILVKRLIMQGFITMDFMDQRESAPADLQSCVASSQLKVEEDVIDSLQNTPQALIGLLACENRRKRMIRL